MPLRKLELITRYFRTFNYTKLDIRDQGDLSRTFQGPSKRLKNDESMIPFTGRSKEATASPYKAVIVELPTPKPYGKNGKIQTEIPLSNTQSVVVHLLKRLPARIYHVFTDNLFSSPQLFRLLRQLGCGATGTARPNCGINTAMKQIKETGKAPDGTALEYNEVIFIPTEDNQVIQIAWKDSNIVLFLSTVHSGAPHERTPKKRKLPAKRGKKAEAQRLKQIFNGDSFKMIPIPTVAAQYNDEMNHVDRGDQIRSYTTKGKGGYLQPISGNAQGPTSRYGCKVCDVAICNNADSCLFGLFALICPCRKPKQARHLALWSR
ncbi:Uncharacterized protein HZ326_27646 [Fusarium oxysporum f. sp. albedinis]|nr:Uncharacterized protein HZ326_27646 [Fusarium oxysporum f. sp. albedinis]